MFLLAISASRKPVQKYFLSIGFLREAHDACCKIPITLIDPLGGGFERNGQVTLLSVAGLFGV